MTDETKANEKKGKTAKKGDIACVHYTGKLETGEVFDSSRAREPLEFEVGSDQLIQGFDSSVHGMKVGEKKEIVLNPDEAYGERDERRLQPVPRDMLPKEPEPKPGMMLTMKAPTGQVFPARIDKVEKDIVVLDLNHPLAGKKLNFEIELVGIKEKKEKKDDCGCSECGCK